MTQIKAIFFKITRLRAFIPFPGDVVDLNHFRKLIVSHLLLMPFYVNKGWVKQKRA